MNVFDCIRLYYAFIRVYVTVLTSKDLRKTRLTLRMLNDLRKAGDARDKEQKEHLEFVKVMYAPPPPEAAAV